MKNILILTFLIMFHAEAKTNVLDLQVKSILEKHCFSCHGSNGRGEAGFDYATNLQKLVQKNMVVPHDLTASYLYERAVITKDMPPNDAPKLNSEESNILKKWIESGATVEEDPTLTEPEFISPNDVLTWVVADLNSLTSKKQRADARYLSFTSLYNLYQTRPVETNPLSSFNKGLTKLLNSLSRTASIVNPVAIDPKQTVFRILLSDYGFDSALWEKIAEKNPFVMTYLSPLARQIYSATSTLQPILRADWFVATTSVPPLYHDILQIPKTDFALEQSLQIDAAENIQRLRVSRAGFLESGVSANNRIIERHEQPNNLGAYWKSYDFANNEGRQNILSFPLGPENFADNFSHAGGEIIWNLPNGLQAYFLAQTKVVKGRTFGERIDKAPQTIVSDPLRPDKAVINGLSCMSCHNQGMKGYKTDIVRNYIQKNNPFLFPAVGKLYPTNEVMKELLDKDRNRFVSALAKMGIVPSEKEPILRIVEQFELPLDLNALAFELGSTPSQLKNAISSSQELKQSIGILLEPGKTMKREAITESFKDLSEAL